MSVEELVLPVGQLFFVNRLLEAEARAALYQDRLQLALQDLEKMRYEFY